MKLFVRMIVIAIALFSVGGPLAAQSKHQRISREALAEVQAKHIASELSLDEATTQKFVDTYTQFQKELWALRPRTKRNLQKAQTDEEIDRAMQARFEQSQKILELRKQYYAHYREFTQRGLTATTPQRHKVFPVYSFFLTDPNGYNVEFQKILEK